MRKLSPSILVVESDPVQSDLIRLALKRLDAEVISTRDAAETKELMLKHQPFMLLLDTFYPHASGFDLIEDLRSEHLLQHCHLVVISSLGFAEIVSRAAKAGACEFFVKPVDTDLLVQKTARLLKEESSVTLSKTLAI